MCETATLVRVISPSRIIIIGTDDFLVFCVGIENSGKDTRKCLRTITIRVVVHVHENRKIGIILEDIDPFLISSSSAENESTAR